MIWDLRYAFRALRKAPGFTIATVLTLALGIGANSAIFSVANAVLLKPLPFEHPEQLVAVYTRSPGDARDYVSQPDQDDWRAMARSFRQLASLVVQSVNLTGRGEPERVIGGFVSADFFPMLGVQAASGRLFAPGEDRLGAQPVAVMTDALWRNHFGGDPSIVGRSFNFNGESYTIAGILPRGFAFPLWDSDVYLPSFKYPNYTVDRATPVAAVFGRLRDGVSLPQAQAEMTSIAVRLAAAFPATNRDRGTNIVPLKNLVVEDLRAMVVALAGAVAFVLLIGCANVAGLLVARMVATGRERAIRVALGASRAHLMSYVLAEALILALAGGVVGLLMGTWIVPAIAKAAAPYLPAGTAVTIDGAVVWFTAAVSLAVSLLVAAIPAWQSSGARPLGGEGRGAGWAAGRNRARTVLVAGEMALVLVLLAGAGLMIRSLIELGRVSTGFDPHNLLTLEYRIPRSKYPSPAAQVGFHQQVVESVKSIPGVLGATSVRAVPLGGNGEMQSFLIADRPEPPAAQRPRGLINAADPNFIETMRIPVLRGRVFTAHDGPEQPMVAVINQTLARRYFSDRDPLGRHIRLPASNLTVQIVGVVGDVKQFSLDDTASSQIYRPLAQVPFIFTSLAVRTAGDPDLLANQVRRAIWRVDKDQPVWKVRSVESRIAALVEPRRLVTVLLGGYAALALLLAAIGVFGVISYAVSQRSGEIGVRVALGAQPRDIVALVLRQGLAMTAAGVAVGVAAAAWLSRYLRSLLYGVRPFDAGVYALVAALLVTVALAASLVPARRALRVDPVEALRRE